jgi:hypothetical protein
LELRENATADYAKLTQDAIEGYRTVIKTFKLELN